MISQRWDTLLADGYCQVMGRYCGHDSLRAYLDTMRDSIYRHVFHANKAQGDHMSGEVSCIT